MARGPCGDSLNMGTDGTSNQTNKKINYAATRDAGENLPGASHNDC